MAGASASVYKFNSVVRGKFKHVHKSVWSPHIDKTHKCIMLEDNNEQNEYTVNDLL